MRKHPLPGKMITITLPWPANVLNPNDRSHWAQKSRARSRQRGEAWTLTRSLVNKTPVTFPEGNIPLKITLHSPDNRGRDGDNLIASLKGAMDGIAEALGVDDKRFRPVSYDFGANVKDGQVVVVLG